MSTSDLFMDQLTDDQLRTEIADFDYSNDDDSIDRYYDEIKRRSLAIKHLDDAATYLSTVDSQRAGLDYFDPTHEPSAALRLTREAYRAAIASWVAGEWIGGGY